MVPHDDGGSVDGTRPLSLIRQGSYLFLQAPQEMPLGGPKGGRGSNGRPRSDPSNRWVVHYWMGARCGVDKAGAAAALAVQLKALIETEEQASPPRFAISTFVLHFPRLAHTSHSHSSYTSIHRHISAFTGIHRYTPVCTGMHLAFSGICFFETPTLPRRDSNHTGRIRTCQPGGM